uniref:Uncharacterized protein n=1 Tax=Romanomermis culicivorax TaxID=13658 RepID=A0A915KQZ1_ROMCU
MKSFVIHPIKSKHQFPDLKVLELRFHNPILASATATLRVTIRVCGHKPLPLAFILQYETMALTSQLPERSQLLLPHHPMVASYCKEQALKPQKHHRVSDPEIPVNVESKGQRSMSVGNAIGQDLTSTIRDGTAHNPFCVTHGSANGASSK